MLYVGLNLRNLVPLLLFFFFFLCWFLLYFCCVLSITLWWIKMYISWVNVMRTKGTSFNGKNKQRQMYERTESKPQWQDSTINHLVNTITCSIENRATSRICNSYTRRKKSAVDEIWQYQVQVATPTDPVTSHLLLSIGIKTSRNDMLPPLCSEWIGFSRHDSTQ